MATLADLVAPKPEPKGRTMLRDLVRGFNREAVSGVLGAPVDLANTLANLLIAGGGFAAHKAGLINQPPELIDNARAVGSSDWIYNRLPNQPAMTGSGAETAGRLVGAIASPPAVMATAPRTLGSLVRYGMERAPQAIDNYMRSIGGIQDAIVYHGSPHKFDAFDMSKIGTGEGAQAYGHGLYFAESPDVAASYKNLVHRDPTRLTIDGKVVSPDSMFGRAAEDVARIGVTATLQKIDDNIRFNEKYAPDMAEVYRGIRRQIEALDPNRVNLKSGSLYTVDLPDSAIARMLDWDKPLSQQQQIISILDRSPFTRGLPAELTGEQVYRNLGAFNRAGASEVLKNKGIPGIRYLDGASRGAGAGTSNFVVFDDKLPKILKRE